VVRELHAADFLSQREDPSVSFGQRLGGIHCVSGLGDKRKYSPNLLRS